MDVKVEVGQVARDDTARGIRAIPGSLAENVQELGGDYPGSVWQDILASMGPDSALNVLLARWRRADPTPLALLMDEIDSLVGDTLLSVLRQLRAGYEQRPEGFPQSVVLCRVRDIRDYRTPSMRRLQPCRLSPITTHQTKAINRPRDRGKSRWSCEGCGREARECGQGGGQRARGAAAAARRIARHEPTLTLS